MRQTEKQENKDENQDLNQAAAVEKLEADGLISDDDLFDAARALIEAASARHMSVCSCESFTAGLFCAAIGSVPGASAVLQGGLVTYQSAIKERVAHVEAQIIEEHGVISAACARAMALQTREIMEADWCVSFTGNAGPSAMEDRPAGLIYCAIAGKEQCTVYKACLHLERNALRKQAVRSMLVELTRIIEEIPKQSE